MALRSIIAIFLRDCILLLLACLSSCLYIENDTDERIIVGLYKRNDSTPWTDSTQDRIFEVHRIGSLGWLYSLKPWETVRKDFIWLPIDFQDSLDILYYTYSPDTLDVVYLKENLRCRYTITQPRKFLMSTFNYSLCKRKGVVYPAGE